MAASPPTASSSGATPEDRERRARVVRVVRQHARTAELMGVDFVPSYRSTPMPIEQPAAAVPVVAKAEPQVTGVSEPGEAMARTKSPAERLKPEPAVVGAVASALRGKAPKKIDPDLSPEAAAAALADLRARYEADAPHKHFVTHFTNIVFGEGDPRAKLCFVGEAPGEEEDKTGRPFVGRAGQLLEKMIVAMGLSRESVYICNVLKTRPPNNATPTPQEAALCEPYLQEQLAIVSPMVIVTLGLPATKLVLKTDDTMAKLRGQFRDIALQSGKVVPVMPTYHPAFLLRSYTPENRAKVWSDLQQVMKLIGLKPKAGPG